MKYVFPLASVGGSAILLFHVSRLRLARLRLIFVSEIVESFDCACIGDLLGDISIPAGAAA
jgi:hypothetical protein